MKTYLFAAFVALCPVTATWAADQVIHVSTTGNDARRGASAEDAVATLERALALAGKMPARQGDAIRIELKAGTYLAQSATTRGNPQGAPILITSASGGRAVFDGNGQGGTWLVIKPRNGEPSGLGIKDLDIINYETAIDVQGSRNTASTWAGGIEIRGNRFARIGDIARTGAPPSTAAIRLVNSDKNVIADNKFTGIRNAERCALLHAIYVAHGSTDNLIEGNTFEDSCGDAVRFRDRSDNNIVRRNQFTDAWAKSPISDWFCNAGQRDDCTKAAGECPSSNLLLEGNKVSAKGTPAVAVFLPYGGKAPPACAIPGGTERAIIR